MFISYKVRGHKGGTPVRRRVYEKEFLSLYSKDNKSTKFGAQLKLIYYEASLNREDARAREKYLKSGMGKRYVKNRLKFFFV